MGACPMRDIDGGDREVDRTHDGSDTDPVLERLKTSGRCLANQVGFSTLSAPIREFLRAVELLNTKVKELQASHQELQEELRTYMRRSASSLSAARMHVPIGGTQGRIPRVNKKIRSK